MTLLTKEQILGVDKRPPGFSFLERFCEVVEAGETPSPEMLKSVSESFRILLKHGDENMTLGLSMFADALGLHKEQLNRRVTPGKEDVKIFTAFEYIREAKSNKKPKGVIADEAANRYFERTGKTVTGKTVRRWAREYKSG